MNVLTPLVLSMLYCVVSAAVTCPPSCDPPKHVTGCNAYERKECKNDIRDVSISVASCGCLWQSHIQLVEPDAKIVFTDAGNQCYKWASEVCAVLEKRESVSIVKPMEELLRRVKKLETAGEVALQKEIAKSRRRTGVTFAPEPSNTEKAPPKPVVNSVNFIGRHDHGTSSEWVEVQRKTEVVDNSAAGKSGTQNASSPGISQTVHHFFIEHWLNLKMQEDQFKLVVFMIVLGMNILVIVGMVLCRDRSTSQKVKEAKQCGDLDLSTFRPKKTGETRKSFFEKLKWHPGKKQNTPAFSYVQMENENADRFREACDRYAQTSSTFLPVLRPEMVQPNDTLDHYDTLEDSILDNTYEEPLSVAPRGPMGQETRPRSPSMQEMFSRRYSFEAESEGDSSPTKYFMRQKEDPRTVSFALPEGTYLTLQDRVDGIQSTATEKVGTNARGTKNGSHQGQ